ncbi:RagB/SusD family nutrient uptake outer membrane protein [Bacteroides faecis]|nr:RagB/SusD family nutrient uptake outer membrane protein [Bacteroides faecis]MCS3070110.1 RagB/SusD family nutrient uptake outer membrane protein [Bacteroides faecis]
MPEVLLNYAEACYRTNDVNNATNNAVREIRSRVGLPYSDKMEMH